MMIHTKTNHEEAKSAEKNDFISSSRFLRALRTFAVKSFCVAGFCRGNQGTWGVTWGQTG